MARIENEPVANAAPPTWFSGEYQYDGSGNIHNIGATTSPYTDGQPTLSSDGKANSYTYDLLGRLTTATVNNDAGNHSESYTYDPFGNLTSRTTDGTVLNVSVDQGTNRQQQMSYDAAGNLTQNGVENYWYDSESRMRAKAAGWYSAETYLYDADDERIAVNFVSDVWRWTIRDFDGKVLREYEGGSQNNSTWLWVEDDIYRESQLVAAERMPQDGGQRHFHTDHLGTPRLITGANGLRYANHDYYPFGTEVTDLRQEMTDHGFDRPEPRKFTSHERDFTGGTDANNTDYLDYMHARYYNPNVGRFLSIDPTWSSADVGTPQSWNRYSYVLNNPVRHTDPDGRVCADIVSCTAEVGFAVGNVPGMVIGIVGGAAIGYGITHPAEVAALGNSLGGAGGGDSPALERHARNAGNYFAEKVNAPQTNGSSPGPSNSKGSASQQDPNNDKSREKAIKSLEQRIDEHKQKLEAYKANPDEFDNKGILKDAPNAEVRQRIIDGRIKHLEHEIQTFQNQVDTLRNQ